jgi:hypothetical protein
MKTLRVFVVSALAIAILGSVVHSQDTGDGQKSTAGASVAGTAAIVGRAHNGGSALPGVKVGITGPGVHTTVVTDGDGGFDVRAAFQAADYELRFELPGFATIRRLVAANPMGLASVSVDMHVCDITLEHISIVDLGLPDTLRLASAVVQFKIATVVGPRPAQEAGEGVCGGQEFEIAGTSVRTAKLATGLYTPRSFLVRSGRTGFEANQEFLAFLWWNPTLNRYVPGGYMVQVVDGRIAWGRADRSVLQDGMPVADAVAALERLARRRIQ